MSERESKPRVLNIRKYSNRRYYDTTRSRHLTLADIYDLIRSGHDVAIHDSRTGEDITNVVLTQMILEREPPKLEILPANILHEVIRTQQQFLGTVVEQYFRQVLDAQRASQERWAAFLRNTLGMTPMGALSGALDWTRYFSGGSSDGNAPRDVERVPPSSSADGEPQGASEGPAGPDDEIAELRQRIEALQQRIESGRKRSARRRKR